MIAAEHLEFLGSLDGVARANAEILEGLKADGVFVVNADDERSETIAGTWPGRKLRFGRGAAADVTVEDVAPDETGSRFRLKTPEDSVEVSLPVPGLHQVANFVAASAIAIAAGASAEDCAAAAPVLTAAVAPRRVPAAHVGRASVRRRLQREPALDARRARHAEAAAGTRKIAVLGDMLELGPEDLWWHREAGRYASSRVDRLLCVGPRAESIGEGAIEAGLSAGADPCRGGLRRGGGASSIRCSPPGDAVLFKASRGIGLDRAVAKLSRPRPTDRQRPASRGAASAAPGGP